MDAQGVFDSIKKLRQLLDTLKSLGIDWNKLGELGDAVQACIKVLRDTTATTATKVAAVIVLLETAAKATTAITWDDSLVATLKTMEPFIVRLVSFLLGENVATAMDDAQAAGIDVGMLWKIAQMIFEIIQLFLTKE